MRTVPLLIVPGFSAGSGPLKMEFSFSRSVLSMSVAAALLAGCGGSQALNGATGAASDSGDSLPYHKTFQYTGKKQTFVVPAGVKWLTVVALGGAGAGSPGARGGRVFAELPVISGEHLAVFVGGAANGTSGGFNGGGSAKFYTRACFQSSRSTKCMLAAIRITAT
jgi:hypothetical protein